MRVLLINSVCGIGSTGRICGELADHLSEQGHDVRIAYGRSDEMPEAYRKYAVRIGDRKDVILHVLLTRITDRHGLGSRVSTLRFLKWMDRFGPEMIWLHNIHGYYLNYELLFSWIKDHPEVKVRWTLHDCWAFTGHCAYFSAQKCEKWEKACFQCPNKRQYPQSLFFDNSGNNYDKKRQAFLGVKGMTLQVPSNWLKKIAERSFLSEYPIEVVPNEIDHSVFYPRQSNFRELNHLHGKIVVLGVANVWEKRKGLAVFEKLAEMLPHHYRIVLVGITEKQKKKLPNEMIAIPRTSSSKQLAEIYTAADIFVNPSEEETFGMTILEAAACGAKVICYKGTACEEAANLCGGIAVEKDLRVLCKTIMRMGESIEGIR